MAMDKTTLGMHTTMEATDHNQDMASRATITNPTSKATDSMAITVMTTVIKQAKTQEIVVHVWEQLAVLAVSYRCACIE